MKAVITFSLIISFAIMTSAQDLPFEEIPQYPNEYTTGTVMARLVEGLGYRYYWATEGLTSKDLEYKPSSNARTSEQTIDHIYGLSVTIVNAVQSKVNVRPMDFSGLTFEDKRKSTLENLRKTSEILRSEGGSDLESFKVIFERDGNRTEFPFWNMINGPISDALWHTGQIVSFRRASGNPLNPKVSVFRGKTRE